MRKTDIRRKVERTTGHGESRMEWKAEGMREKVESTEIQGKEDHVKKENMIEKENMREQDERGDQRGQDERNTG